MSVGLTYTQALDIPFGELLDYIAIEQVKREEFRLRKAMTDDEIIPDVR
jgi:hypothetical protein|nr:MAG TPA: hypothetical protein [Caudoviricetes sp.]DAT96874.1 MAG TPA: hypothetical protein [Caudoviricetes sp.]DAW66578.1 MAG TPA: hypothetical protein [Caudoviricetes sp.]